MSEQVEFPDRKPDLVVRHYLFWWDEMIQYNEYRKIFFEIKMEDGVLWWYDQIHLNEWQEHYMLDSLEKKRCMDSYALRLLEREMLGVKEKQDTP